LSAEEANRAIGTKVNASVFKTRPARAFKRFS